MAKLETLRPVFTDVGDLQVQADGYALWMVWQGGVNPVVLQTMEDYGGFKAAEEGDQALWFFFSTDALLAAARLGVWARFNSLPLVLLIFPARFVYGQAGDKNLIINEELWKLSVEPPDGFGIFAHNSVGHAVETSPGLKLVNKEVLPSLEPDAWSLLEVDPRLPYQSPLAWYTVLRPLGSPQDKAFHQGWREFLSQLEALLQRNKLRFSVHESTLMFPVDSLRQVRLWCRDVLSLIIRLKEEMPDQYWPCAMAIVDRKGLTLNEDLPNRIGVSWEHMVPDYPHMSLRNALMLGPDFAAHAVRFAPVTHHPDDWASVSLSRDQSGNAGAIPHLVPVKMVLGDHEHCFYCGQRSHVSRDCPSRRLDPQEPGIWPQMARLGFSSMRDGVRHIDSALAECETPEEWSEKVAELLREEDATGIMARAFYDIGRPLQLRAVGTFWRARNKDLQKLNKNMAPMDNSPVWAFLAEFPDKDASEAEREIKELLVKYAKDFRLYTLRGYLAMERGDGQKAEQYWKEAEVYSPHPVLQAWHALLQARSLECRGMFTQAEQMYEQVLRSCPSWHDAEYRKAVCRIKVGFPESAITTIMSLIERNGHFFNKALIDPEMERGCIQVLACLYRLWTETEARAKEETGRLERLRDELGAWFLPENEFAGQMAERIEKVLQLTVFSNFVAFQMLVSGRAQIDRDLQQYVLQETRDFKNRFRGYSEKLKVIHDESAWFPFPRTLVEFNRNYNEGAANINWAMTAHLHTPDAFRKAQLLDKTEADRLKKLEGRLKFLRIIRDSTLFMLSMTQTFLWLEVVCIVFIFVLLPLILIYGDKVGLEMVAGALAKERWQIQKVLFILVSFLALGIAGLRTLFRFETIRDNILAKAGADLKKALEKKK